MNMLETECNDVRLQRYALKYGILRVIFKRKLNNLFSIKSSIVFLHALTTFGYCEF